MILQGTRLFLRNWVESDATHYMTLANDVGYNCFSTPGRFLVRTMDEAQQKIVERMKLFKEAGLGKFPIFLKDTGKFIGTCGLESFDFDGRSEIEMGYRLCLKYWGKGYASESAAAALRYGFDDLRLKKIMALVLPQNVPSLRVLEKLGARYRSDFLHGELMHRLYAFPQRQFGSGGI